MTADPTVLDLADRAAQAVSDLNHRTRHADAFTGPAQLYRLVGDLGLLVGGLPQLLGQLEGWLHAEHDAGRVRSDNHADAGPTVGGATAHLAEPATPRMTWPTSGRAPSSTWPTWAPPHPAAGTRTAHAASRTSPTWPPA